MQATSGAAIHAAGHAGAGGEAACPDHGGLRQFAAADRGPEQTKDDPYPACTAGRRPNRQKVYSVRLSAEEEAKAHRVGAARHLPASTLVRSWILERLDQEGSA